jgi:hypothetical protein
MSDVQKQVQKAIDELVEPGAERGIQVAAAATRLGEMVTSALQALRAAG